MKRTYKDAFPKSKGFISAYLHRGDMEFVQLGDSPNHGFYKPRTTIEMLDERHIKNLIVTNASKFMAKRMRPNTNYTDGITYLEIGTGVGSGTTQAPQAESATQTTLRVPLARNAISSWTCLDANSNPTASDTNVIQYTTVFTEAQANGANVEMGMFGGDATATLGSGQMFNYKTFPVINKDNTMQLTLVWKITY